MKIREYLKQHRLVTDGAMGTYYAEKKHSASLVSEWANLTEPEVIGQIHREYLEAGAVLLRTNTFAAGRRGLGISGQEQEELVRAACRIAKEEIAAFAARTGKECFLAGDIGPLRDFSETGGEENTKEEYEALIDIFLSEGVDAVLFETFPEIGGIADAAAYAKRKNPEVFCIAEFSVNKNGYSAGGIRAGRLLELAEQIDALDAAGFNCGVGSGHMLALLEGVRLPEKKYFCISPNAGYPEQLQNRMVFQRNAGYFAENMREIAKRGVAVLGACCGSSPEYIRELAGLAEELPPAVPAGQEGKTGGHTRSRENGGEKPNRCEERRENAGEPAECEESREKRRQGGPADSNRLIRLFERRRRESEQ
ncbi:MAG: homocysteine S-methyltransferase family protein, partial [Lachnospiraceae bacterium]|nr:homocysteine S-methyltransferase family protein [Lachnospiraceae bacterium]